MVKIEMSLGPYRVAVEDAFKKIENNKIIKRIWDMDHTVWKMEPEGDHQQTRVAQKSHEHEATGHRAEDIYR